MGVFIYEAQNDDIDTNSNMIYEYTIDPALICPPTYDTSAQLRSQINAPIFVEFDTTNTNGVYCYADKILSNMPNLNSTVTFNSLALYPYSEYHMYENWFTPIKPFEWDNSFNGNVHFTGAAFLRNWFFSNCLNFNGIISAYNENIPTYDSKGKYSVTYYLDHLFHNCQNFNNPVTTNFICNIITKAVLDFNCWVHQEYMFDNCYNFNQPWMLYNGDYVPLTSSHGMFANCYNFDSPVKLSLTDNATSFNVYRLLYNCYNMSQDIKLKFNASRVTYFDFREMLNGRNTASRINVFASNTDILYNARYSLVGPPLTWSQLPDEDCIYNESYNIYLYNNL